jgi:polygalacturonase
MTKLFIQLIIILSPIIFPACSNNKSDRNISEITPNQFDGSDIHRIQSAINTAKGTTNIITIPSRNANGTNLWLLDSAILLPANMTIILENCTLQLSDQSRDNMFRSDNVGMGILNPKWNHNVRIIGVGNVTLKGANNPRATGDGARTLVSVPQQGRVSYGSDAGREGIKQKGDWRNIMILIAYVDGFTLKNVSIENSHAWAVSFERTRNAHVSDIRIDNPEEIDIGGRKVIVSNKDGINLRQGCKNFRIDNISGKSGDDFIALSSLSTRAPVPENGDLNSTMVTSGLWRGPEDDAEQIMITNISCQTKFRGVAIRASDSASIHHVYIDGLHTRKWDGYHNSILIGGKGYGQPSQPGKIHDIYAMNITGEGRSLILVEAPIANCTFMNGIYFGDGDQVITYKIDKTKTTNIGLKNLIKTHQR